MMSSQFHLFRVCYTRLDLTSPTGGALKSGLVLELRFLSGWQFCPKAVLTHLQVSAEKSFHIGMFPSLRRSLLFGFFLHGAHFFFVSWICQVFWWKNEIFFLLLFHKVLPPPDQMTRTAQGTGRHPYFSRRFHFLVLNFSLIVLVLVSGVWTKKSWLFKERRRKSKKVKSFKKESHEVFFLTKWFKMI